MPSRRSFDAIVLSATLAPAVCACIPATPELADPIGPVQAAWTPPRPGPIVSVFPGPSLVVEKVTGAESARVGAAFAPASAAIRECRPGSGGVIRLTLTSEGGRSAYAVEPGTTLDPRARRCVLGALSTVELEGIHGDPSPSARPSGFTAHLRIEW